jgi:acetyl-CoA acetyltransferase
MYFYIRFFFSSIGPVSAISGALKKAGLTLKDMDLVDVSVLFLQHE